MAQPLTLSEVFDYLKSNLTVTVDRKHDYESSFKLQVSLYLRDPMTNEKVRVDHDWITLEDNS